MKFPAIAGTIDRRILINYNVDPEVVSRFLPKPFLPKLYEGRAIVGICLIRLKRIRPKGLPAFVGVSSENGAHRIAVEWNENGRLKEGVFIPRRDTSSRLNYLAGGRVFPGVHHLARFNVQESDGLYRIAFDSADGTSLLINARDTTLWNQDSVFPGLDAASLFMEKGSCGYSPGRDADRFEGLELRTFQWRVSPLGVSEVRSSFFDDRSIFPEGSVRFDCALLMSHIEHEWRSAAPPQVLRSTDHTTFS